MNNHQFVWFIALLVAVPAASQSVNMSRPSEIHAQHHATPEEIRDRQAAPQLQKDAKDLAELCSSIREDMNGVQQGLLGKDVLERLKRLERLSKHVREELTRLP
jgi:hypothetical protein